MRKREKERGSGREKGAMKLRTYCDKVVLNQGSYVLPFGRVLVAWEFTFYYLTLTIKNL